jgi:plastocyanin
MTRIRKWIAGAAALGAAVSLASAPRAGEEPPRRVVIEIRGFRFAPETVRLRPGDTVVWVNRDLVPHTATAADRSWDSGLIKPGGRWTMTVTFRTGLAYFCRYHPSMKAGLRIGTAPGSQAAPPPPTRRPGG